MNKVIFNQACIAVGVFMGLTGNGATELLNGKQ